MLETLKPFAVRDEKPTHVIIEIFGGDNNLSAFVMEDMQEIAAGNTGTTAVLALADVADGEARVFELSPRTGNRVLEEWGEIDTGDPETLSRFLSRALLSYGAGVRKAIGFWDHGSGIFDENDPNEVMLERRLSTVPRRHISRSRPARRLFFKRSGLLANPRMRAMLHDDTTGGVLTNLEAKHLLEDAFERSGHAGQKVDLIFSDTCLNGMVEVAAQLDDFAHCIVGSEELEPGDGWEYHEWLGLMSAAPPATPFEWAKQAVEAFERGYRSRPQLFPCTLAAFRTDNRLPDAFKKLVDAASPLGNDGFAVLDRARRSAQGFAQRDTYDLRDFATKTADVATQAPLRSAANELVSAFDAARVAAVALGDTVADSHGLAFWFPSSRHVFRSDAPTYARLDFDLATGWSAYLGRHL